MCSTPATIWRVLGCDFMGPNMRRPMSESTKPQHTVVYAIWQDGKLHATTFYIDNQDRLRKRQRTESGVIHSDWWP